MRDAPLGLIWEGTSNIISLDAIQRAVAKERAHVALVEDLQERLGSTPLLPGQFRTRLEAALKRAACFAEEVAAHSEHERFCRVAASGLYHATTAVLLAVEGALLGAAGGDARRLLLARFVIEHRLEKTPPTSLRAFAWEDEAIPLLLSDETVPLDQAAALTVR